MGPAWPYRPEPEDTRSPPESEVPDSTEEWQRVGKSRAQRRKSAGKPAVSATAAATAAARPPAALCQRAHVTPPRAFPPEVPFWEELPDSWGAVVRTPPRQPPQPAPAPEAKPWNSWRVAAVEDSVEWPGLPPAAPRPAAWPARPRSAPAARRPGAIVRPAVGGPGRRGAARDADAALAEALQELEIMESQGYRWLPSKKERGVAHHAGTYQAGAHLLTLEEREREVERGTEIAGRECGAAASTDAMRRMMGSPTKRGAELREEEFVTTKDATNRVHSGKHLQRSMLESGWRPAPGKKHPKWKKELNGVTLSICHASTPGDRRHLDSFAAKLQRMERDAFGI